MKNLTYFQAYNELRKAGYDAITANDKAHSYIRRVRAEQNTERSKRREQYSSEANARLASITKSLMFQ